MTFEQRTELRHLIDQARRAQLNAAGGHTRLEYVYGKLEVAPGFDPRREEARVRRAAGETVTAIAQSLGLHHSSVSKWLNAA